MAVSSSTSDYIKANEMALLHLQTDYTFHVRMSSCVATSLPVPEAQNARYLALEDTIYQVLFGVAI